MKYQGKLIQAVGLFVALAVGSAPAFAQHIAPTQPQSVLVLNGTGQPVPTSPQGTTNVAGTVSIGNTPSVTVANTPSVNIANTPTVALSPGGTTGITNPLNNQNDPKPLAVLEAFQPYEDGCSITITSGISGGCTFDPIPGGKRFVVEEFDAQTFTVSGIRPINISLNVSGFVSHNFPATFMGTQGADDYFATHQQTRMYGAAGYQPVCGAVLTDTAAFATVFCRYSGYLVDLP